MAKGKDASGNREPMGIVYIEPTRHTLLYSVISPVSSAIAAGNCIVVLLERTLRECNAVLRRILISALEKDCFAIADQPVTTELPANQTMFVLQEGDERLPRSNQLVSVSSPCVAVVDRTADLELAARELVTARFAFGGRSPYAADVVLVNEFVLKDFLRAVVQECVNYSRTGMEVANGSTVKGAKSSVDEIRTGIEALRRNDAELRVIVQEAKFAVVEAVSRKSLLEKRLEAAILTIHSIRSLDDGIDTICSRPSSPCTATYHLGSPETGKYLSQFMPSAASFVNHVPRELLLGPASPQSHTLDLANRYPANLFTVPRPQYIVPTAESQKLAPAFAADGNSYARQLAAEAVQDLQVMNRASGKSVGFFEQGFLMNASLILSGIIATSIVGGYTIYTRWRR